MDYKSHLRESMKLTDREVGAFGELFLPIRQAQSRWRGKVLRLAASTDVVSEFPEGARLHFEATTRQGFCGRHPQTLAECGSAVALRAMARLAIRPRTHLREASARQAMSHISRESESEGVSAGRAVPLCLG